MSDMLKAFSLVPTVLFAALLGLFGWVSFPTNTHNKYIGAAGAIYILTLGMRYVAKKRALPDEGRSRT